MHIYLHFSHAPCKSVVASIMTEPEANILLALRGALSTFRCKQSLYVGPPGGTRHVSLCIISSYESYLYFILSLF